MNYDMTLSLEFLKAHPLDAARALERIQINDTASFIEQVPPDIAANIIRMMDHLVVLGCFESMEPEVISAILQKLPLEIAAMILRKMNSILKESVMKTFPDEILSPIDLMLRFPEDTAGALMDPRYFILPQDIQVKEAIRRIRYHLKQNTSYIYVINRDHVLVGFINIHEILNLDPKIPISSIINTDIWKLSARSGRQEILMNPGWREFHALPVVDEKGIFLGVIDYKTIRRIEQDIIKPPQYSSLNQTTAAMGELFWMGLSGLVKGAASAISRLNE